MKHIRLCAALAGIVLVAAVIHKIGSGEVFHQLRWLHIALPIVIVAGAVRIWVQTRAWHIALRADGVDIPQSRLVGIRLAAQAGDTWRCSAR